MAITFVSHSTLSYGGRTNSTVTAPASITDGDILVAIGTVYSGGTSVTAPSGFSAFTGFPEQYGADATAAHTYWKRASSESGNYTFSHSSASTEWDMLVFRGCVASGSVEDVTPSKNESNSGTITATGITTSTNGAMIVMGAHGYNGFDASAPSGSTPTFTLDYDGTITWAAYGEMTTAGATGDKSLGTGDAFHAELIALKPATTAASGSHRVPGGGWGGRVISDQIRKAA